MFGIVWQTNKCKNLVFKLAVNLNTMKNFPLYNIITMIQHGITSLIASFKYWNILSCVYILIILLKSS